MQHRFDAIHGASHGVRVPYIRFNEIDAPGWRPHFGAAMYIGPQGIQHKRLVAPRQQFIENVLTYKPGAAGEKNAHRGTLGEDAAGCIQQWLMAC
jgi:hypothetical protein